MLQNQTKEEFMKRRDFLAGTAAVVGAGVLPRLAWAFPTVYPHGTTLYRPEKCWNGFTVFPVEKEGEGCVLIDMNGNVVKQWKSMSNLEHPVKILKGGYVMGATRQKPEMVGRTYNDPMSADLSVMDFEGKIVRNIPLAGMHHDFQVEGHPTGYYSPGMDVSFNPSGRILVLSHLFTENAKITDRKPLDDDYIFEVDKDNKVTWDWLASDHFDEMNFPDDLKTTMRKYPNWIVTRTPGVKAADWIHMNSMSELGPNKWYDADKAKYAAFHPDNIITCNRQTQTVFIIDKQTKKIVWHIGPTFYSSDTWEFAGTAYPRALSRLGQIVGPHHAHMIPKGLPGEGDIMIYDNGGFGGYGERTPTSPWGINNSRRDYSRVIQFNPETLEKTWEHSASAMGLRETYKFYSDYVSSAQRLPNGNTLICEGSDGRLFEITANHEIVWEYISPYKGVFMPMNMIYRAYRVPYEWVPQEARPEEKPVAPLDLRTFRVPGAAP
jgi:hypothetical protein